MKITTILKWLFVYLPVRFTVPFLGLLAWFLFYLWPWLLDLLFSTAPTGDARDTFRHWLAQWLVPDWIEALNLTPAVRAAGILALLLGGVLVVYNISALWYQGIRRWPREKLIVGTVLLNVFLYSYPWVFAPKNWADGDYSIVPFYFRRSWFLGFSEYGVLWLMPATVILATLGFEIYSRHDAAKRKAAAGAAKAEKIIPVVNASFEELRGSVEDLRIGLILSGGGAKGVYQAGSMRAIHEFLKRYDCLKNVRMIAGTSIGSWNTLFWLANMVDARPGEPSVHEEWWRTTNVARIIEFDTWAPMFKSSMLRPKPWHENFDEVFRNSSLASVLDSSCRTHFYLTRSNVAQGRLEFGTNWGDEQRQRALRSEDIQLDSFTEPQTIEELRDAAFASMDLPPLFPYSQIGHEYFEDGGVVDNLPVRFGTFVEECDLLFVLALNSSFEAVPSQKSMMARLMRVMDVRQGVLERNSMRMTYLYNHINQLSHSSGTAAVKASKVVRVFAICPEQPLAVDTSEFWKTAEYESAFSTMYDATRVELSRFNFMAEPAVQTTNRADWLRMALVSRAGEITYNYRF